MVLKMGKVVAKVRILPKDMDQFEDLKKDMEGKVSAMEEQPLAFGMKSLVVIFRMEDEGGAQDKLEEELGRHPLISSFEILEVGRI